MKKMKLSLGEGGIKGFLARHAEKFVFGLAVLVVIWVALPDSKRKPIEEGLRPAAIKMTADSASNRLRSEAAWPLIKSERFKEPDNYAARADDSLISIGLDGYPADVPFDKPAFPMDQRRSDPKIYPVEKIEVAVSYGPVVAPDTSARTSTIRKPVEKPVKVDGRPLPPAVQEQMQKFGGLAGGMSGGKVEGKYIVSILGQIPIKRQSDEYKAVFQSAADYNPQRDVPNYGASRNPSADPSMWTYYVVERAEVAPDGTEGKWAAIGYSSSARKQEALWQPMTELADSRYVDPVWTMALPPLMMRDLRPIALHSEVPSQAQAAEITAEPEAAPEEDPMGDLGDPLGGGGGALAPAPVPPRGAGPPLPLGPRPLPMRGGSESMGYGEGSMQNTADTDFKLFRFFDMDVQPGKAYVYRVKLYIEDPNDPARVELKPQTRVLDKSVIERLARKTDKTVWWRESDYSQVSDVVRVPATRQVLAGPVLPPGTLVKENESDRVGTRISETMANLMALVWDEKEAKDVPGSKLAGRGDVLNFKADVEAIDVSASMLVKLPAYKFETNNIVLDVRGGESLGKKSDLSNPGEVLLVDGAGNLIVRKELEDRTSYEANNFPPAPKEEAGDLPGLELTPMPGEKRSGRTPRPPRGSEDGGGLLDGPPPPRRRS